MVKVFCISNGLAYTISMSDELPQATPRVGQELRDQRLPFMFELYDPDDPESSKNYVLPINPSSYRMVHTPRARVTLTHTGGHEDKNGMGLPKIYMKGSFSYFGTYGPHAITIDGLKKSGWDFFKEFEMDIFTAFYERFGTFTLSGEKVSNPVNEDNPPVLNFYNFTDKHYWQIKIDKFEVERNTTQRFLYLYDLQMTALSRIDEPRTIDVDYVLEQMEDLKELPDEEELTFWGKMMEGYKWASSKMNDVINKVDELNGTLSDIRAGVSAFRQGLSDLVNAPFELVEDAIKTVDSVIDTVSSLEDLPHEFTDHMRDTKFTLLSYRSKKNLFESPGLTTAISSTAGQREILTVPPPPGGISEEEGVVSMFSPEETLLDASLEKTSETAVIETPVDKNDSLETISARVLGDAREWRRIAILNNLDYPYILDSDDPLDYLSEIIETGAPSSAITAEDLEISITIIPEQGDLLHIREGSLFETVSVESFSGTTATLGSPVINSYTTSAVITRHEEALTIKKPGDKIRIPGKRNSSIAISSILNKSDYLEQIFGRDEYLDAEGNQVASATGELVTVGGSDNLKMQLTHRTKTAKRELAAIGHPRYGTLLPSFIGKMNMPVWNERALLDARLTLLSDPRVKKVHSPKFVSDNAALYLEAQVTPVNKESSELIRVTVN